MASKIYLSLNNLFLFLVIFLFSLIFTQNAYAQTCDAWRPTYSSLPSCSNRLFQSDCNGSSTYTGTQCCTGPDVAGGPFDYCENKTIDPLPQYWFRCCNNAVPSPSPSPLPSPSPSPVISPSPSPSPAGCQNNADCGVCKQCCAGSPNYCTSYGYYCSGGQIPGCWATPTPAPTSSPGSTPTPTPTPPVSTPTPTPGPNCPYWCANNAEQCGVPCVQYPEYICDQPQQMCCQCPEITPPPVMDKPPPVFQTIMEVRNVTKEEQFVEDCGGYSCNNQPSWPAYCSAPQNDRQCGAGGCPRTLRTQTQAAPGDTVAVRICERNLGEPTHKDIDALWWLNQARPDEKTVVQAGENIDCELPGQPTFGCHDWIIRPPPSIYPYHQQYKHTLNIPYDWFRWRESNCGANDLWNYACVKSQTFYFTVKQDDPSLLNQTISTRASVKTGPYVKPADYHRVESGCNTNWGQYQGFYDRQPECCWGDPTKQEGWYGRCTALDQPSPPPGNCRFGTCNTGEYSEDFFFWSNWISINVKTIAPWIQVTGDVHSNKRIRAPGGP